jgi:hypothetical protein
MKLSGGHQSCNAPIAAKSRRIPAVSWGSPFEPVPSIRRHQFSVIASIVGSTPEKFNGTAGVVLATEIAHRA